jgi:hypothetical protein
MGVGGGGGVGKLMEIKPRVNQHLLVHHEGWIVNGQYAVFYWIPIP